MAYRVTRAFAKRAVLGAPKARGDCPVTRNALIAGAALSSVALIAAGSLLFDRGGIEAPATYAPGHRLQIALVEPVLPKVVRRDPRIAVRTPGPHLKHVASVEPIPLPRQRPMQVAAIALPRASALDSETTGSLGPAHAITMAVAAPAHRSAPPPKPPHKLTAFEKLYGPVRLASLTPQDALNDGGLPRAPYDRQTAVYVIASKKVYMPDGRELEAHSGLGSKLDDPRFVNVRMRGATPPHVYELKLRESLFHGVEAIRLIPIGGTGEIFGRDGLLAHTYMLGPNGDSNGCVSFRNYDAFLAAFKTGRITRLAVIAQLN